MNVALFVSNCYFTMTASWHLNAHLAASLLARFWQINRDRLYNTLIYSVLQNCLFLPLKLPVLPLKTGSFTLQNNRCLNAGQPVSDSAYTSK